MDTLPQTRVAKSKIPTPEEAANWRKLALLLDRILYACYRGVEPNPRDVNAAARLKALLEVE